MHLNKKNELDYHTKDPETILTMKDTLDAASTLGSTMRHITIFVHEAKRNGARPYQYAQWTLGWIPDISVMLDMAERHVVCPCKLVISCIQILELQTTWRILRSMWKTAT
jgi:hypothetical protein